MGQPRVPFIRIEPDNLLRRRVLDDLPRHYPVSQGELDAVEAFLMPLIAKMLIDDGGQASKLRESGLSGDADSQTPRKAVVLRS